MTLLHTQYESKFPKVHLYMIIWDRKHSILITFNTSGYMYIKKDKPLIAKLTGIGSFVYLSSKLLSKFQYSNHLL